MVSSLKVPAVVVIILGLLNACASLVLYMWLAPELNPNLSITIAAFCATTSIVLLVVGVALWNIHSDLEASLYSMNGATAALKKRVDELEKKF